MASIPQISGIYQILCVSTGKMYVGSAVNVAARWRVHLHDLRHGRHHSPILQHAWDKYGADAFLFSVLETVVDKGRLIEREQYFIDKLKAGNRAYGYNIAPKAGSPLGVKHTDETRAKLRIARRRRQVNPNSIAAMRSANLGRPLSDEHRAKIGAAQKGRKFTPEHRRSLSLAKVGRTHAVNPATGLKISAAKTGKKRSPEACAKGAAALRGRKLPPEHRAKLREAAKADWVRRKSKKAVQQLPLDLGDI